MLKECCSEIAPILAFIYNESLAQGTVPDNWRQVNVAPVFKKGEKYDAANYRPVLQNLTAYKSQQFPTKTLLLTVSMVSLVRGLARPNWFSSFMTWLVPWIEL